LIVYSSKLSFVANGNNSIDFSLALGETICFSSLEFTADYFKRLSLSPEEDNSGAIFIGMVHSGSPSFTPLLRTPLTKVASPQVKEGAPDPLTPRVQLLDTLPMPSTAWVVKVYRQLKDILGIATEQQVGSSLQRWAKASILSPGCSKASRPRTPTKLHIAGTVSSPT
jgi:hypothetical protein